jgi:hypothetical protein
MNKPTKTVITITVSFQQGFVSLLADCIRLCVRLTDTSSTTCLASGGHPQIIT